MGRTQLWSSSTLGYSETKATTPCAHAPSRLAHGAALSDVTGGRQQGGRGASHVCGGRGRAHGELRGAGAVRPNARGAGRQQVPGHLHYKQVRGPGRWRGLTAGPHRRCPE